MQLRFGPRIRHPFFPGLNATPAGEARPLNPALYGTFEELVRAADAGALVSRAVFVIHLEDELLLSDSDRDALWERFQVPAFALLLDRKRRVLAFECEAQSGLHVVPRYPIASADTALCECGRPGHKLYPAASQAPLRTLAG